MINNHQIKLVQTAVNRAGLRDRGQYYLILRQYKQSDGKPVTRCKQLTGANMESLLGICESFGWHYPGKAKDYYRRRVANAAYEASFAQLAVIDKLRGDLGWNGLQLGGMVQRISNHRTLYLAKLTPGEAHGLIEALKNMFSRRSGKRYRNLKQLQTDVEARDGNNKKHEACHEAGQEQNTATATL